MNETIAYLKKLCNLTKQDSLCDNEMNITTDMCDTLLNYIEQLKGSLETYEILFKSNGEINKELQQENKELKEQLNKNTEIYLHTSKYASRMEEEFIISENVNGTIKM